MIFRAVIETETESGHIFLVAHNYEQAHEKLEAACCMLFNDTSVDAYNLFDEHILKKQTSNEAAFEDAFLLECGCSAGKTTYAYPDRLEVDEIYFLLPKSEKQRLNAAFEKAAAFDEHWKADNQKLEA